MAASKNNWPKPGMLGYGEAGQAMANSLGEQTGARLIAYDIKQPANPGKAEMLAEPAGLAAADMIFSVVTADQSYAAAESVAPFLSGHHIFLDGNSVSPGTKQATAALISQTGAVYIDLAIMAPILPRGHRTPMLVAGPEQARIAPLLDQLDFGYRWVDAAIGKASIIKMLRSILIKGAESILTECVTAAEGLGIADEILETAGQTLRMDDIHGMADYVMERVAVHGRRRAAEMREVAKTLDELGLSNFMASAIARHQDMIADMALPAAFEDGKVPADRRVLGPLIASRQTK